LFEAQTGGSSTAPTPTTLTPSRIRLVSIIDEAARLTVQALDAPTGILTLTGD
jgi:hypothetical protein